jgi:hypothetical protein
MNNKRKKHAICCLAIPNISVKNGAIDTRKKQEKNATSSLLKVLLNALYNPRGTKENING